MAELIGPTSSYFISQQLRLHYVDWGNPDAPTLVLVHGGRDHARSWDWVAQELRHDYHVVAMDLRGHGDSEWAKGGSYAMAEHVLDLAQFIDMLGQEKVTILAHSLGGAISLLYAGVYPERLERIVAIEGLGPPPEIRKRMIDTPLRERFHSWIGQVRSIAARSPKRYATVEEAAQRMQGENRFLSDEQALHLTRHGVARNEDGSYSWKFDNWVRSFFPIRQTLEEIHELWGRIDCPMLLVHGTESWAGDPQADGRVNLFQNARVEMITEAEHWVHHDRLEEFLRVTREFLSEG